MYSGILNSLFLKVEILDENRKPKIVSLNDFQSVGGKSVLDDHDVLLLVISRFKNNSFSYNCYTLSKI